MGSRTVGRTRRGRCSPPRPERERDGADGAAVDGGGEHAGSDVLLVVPELVGNAVRHAPGPPVLTVEAAVSGVRVTVGDGSAVLPAPRTPDLTGTRGGKDIHAVLPW
ncbi:hypothetical protein [Kitasatospora sp. NBC_01539]|uniref:hypothetical protein n=1 Tax=Kitasatospora sp. NBC_01539 TaxID=2903577 RepID=UPI0038602CBF